MPFWKRKKQEPAEPAAETLGERADMLKRDPAQPSARPMEPPAAAARPVKADPAPKVASSPSAEPKPRAPGVRDTAAKPATRTKSADQRLLEDPVRIFGEVSTLMARDPDYAARPLSDLAWIVRPALATRQVIVARTRGAQEANGAESVAGPKGGPIAFVVWAYVSDAIDAELRRENGRLAALKPHAESWRSGQNMWIVALSGPQAVREQLLAHLKDRLQTERAPAQLTP